MLDASCDSTNTGWRQYLHVTDFAGATCFDEGNGYSAPRKCRRIAPNPLVHGLFTAIYCVQTPKQSQFQQNKAK